MLKLIDKREEIAACEEMFSRRLRAIKHNRVEAVIGYPGGNWETTVYWFPELGFWCAFEIIPKSRYWNAFGIAEPKPGANISIVSEINFPLVGVDRRVGAVFARDNDGSIVIAHRGKIGGGRRGIGKSLFLDAYRGEWETLSEDRRESSVALIASLSSDRLGRQIRSFLSEVERIKASTHQAPFLASNGVQPRFSEEFTGSKSYKMAPSVEAKCDHGLVVNTLAQSLVDKGLVVGNDRGRDLFVLDSSGRMKILFEVKTDGSSQSIYSAIGQLYFHSIALEHRPKLILVLPEKPSAQSHHALSALGISVIAHDLEGGNLRIPSVDRLLR